MALKKDKAFLSETTDATWAQLAARVVRVALERKGVSYAVLAKTLTAMGIKETERSLISRLARGTVKLTLLLQIIDVTGAIPPRLWIDALRIEGPWEARAQSVVAAELGQKPWITPSKLSALLGDIGVEVGETALSLQLSGGAISLARFLQCAVVLGSSSLDRYVDYPDLASAVLDSSGRAVS